MPPTQLLTVGGNCNRSSGYEYFMNLLDLSLENTVVMTPTNVLEKHETLKVQYIYKYFKYTRDIYIH